MSGVEEDDERTSFETQKVRAARTMDSDMSSWAMSSETVFTTGAQ